MADKDMLSLVSQFDPTSAVDIQKAQRAQALAQMIQQQALTPLHGTEMVSGRAVRTSPMEGIAKLFQAYMGAKGLSESDAQLATAMANMRGAADRELSGSPMVSQLSAPTPMGTQTGSEVPNNPVAQSVPVQGVPAAPQVVAPQLPQTQAPVTTTPSLTSPEVKRKLIAMQMAGYPQAAVDAYIKSIIPTDENRTLTGQGIDLGAYGKARLASEQTKALITGKPGDTIINPLNNSERYFAKLPEGMVPNNDGSVTVMPGFVAANNTIEGDKAGAIEYAKNQNTPLPIGYVDDKTGKPFGGTVAGYTDLYNKVPPNVQFGPTVSAGDRKIALADASRPVLQSQTSQEANTTAAKGGIDAIYTQYGTLRTVPDMLGVLERAKELVPKSYAGKFADAKVEVAKFFNNNFGTNIDPSKVANTEELRSMLFRQVLDNLKKMDSTPSEAQQRVLQQAMGSIATDPSAIPRVIAITQEVMRQRVNEHNDTVQQAINNGVKFPFQPIIKLKAPSSEFKIIGVK